MKELIGKRCKIHIRNPFGADLFYDAILKEWNMKHGIFSFTDKFNKSFTFRIDMIQEIREENDNVRKKEREEIGVC
jgi:hypothetical protein